MSNMSPLEPQWGTYPTGAGVTHMSTPVNMSETGSPELEKIEQLLHELKRIPNVDVKYVESSSGIIKIVVYVDNAYVDSAELRYDDLDYSIDELKELLNKVKQYVALRNIVRKVLGQ